MIECDQFFNLVLLTSDCETQVSASGIQGRIQDFVLGGAYRDGNGGVPLRTLPRCLGKRSEHHHLRPKTLATGVFFVFFFALLEVIKQVFTDTND